MAKRNKGLTRAQVADKVTATILEALDQGVAPWRANWSGAPRGRAGNRMQSLDGRAYRGINVWVLEAQSMIRGYSDPRWVTFAGAKRHGGSVRKGERGTAVILWKPIRRKDDNGDETGGTYLLMRYYTVFNVEQCDFDDLPSLTTETLEGSAECEWDSIEAADSIAAAYVNDGGPDVTYAPLQADEAPHWRPLTDTIVMPERSQWKSADAHYSVLFHELTHSTGAKSRLNREELQGYGHRNNRGREELVAEFGAAFLSAHAGLDNSLNGDHASYIESWRKAINADRDIVISAAQRAQKAADLILDASDKS